MGLVKAHNLLRLSNLCLRSNELSRNDQRFLCLIYVINDNKLIRKRLSKRVLLYINHTLLIEYYDKGNRSSK